MFDLVTGKIQHVPSTPAVSIVVSTVVQGGVFGMIFVSSLALASGHVPAVPDVLAFVALAPPPPPPPPPPMTAARPRTSPAPKPLPTTGSIPLLEAPSTIEPEAPIEVVAEEGVTGGVAGGIAGGIVGGVPAAIDGPPPPSAPPAPRRPEVMRIGGQLKAPALIHRVEPDYPLIAQSARIAGIVLLDAIVDAEGHVQTIKVLKGHPLLAPAAINAVKQWQYAPLLLNGDPIPFELTVTLVFRIPESSN